MNYLLDTNIISELRRPLAHEQVKEWVLKRAPSEYDVDTFRGFWLFFLGSLFYFFASF